jgi:hypothetical protein
MAVVGDRVQVPSKRVGEAPRDGVVTGVTGLLLRVRWSTGEVSTVVPSMGSLTVVGKQSGSGGRKQETRVLLRRGASEAMTVAKSSYENAGDCPYFLIKPDPGCPECAAIMLWRFAHSEIVITNGAEIKLADYGWASRHLHMRDTRDAHHKIRVERARKERERKECFHPVA